MALPQPTGNVDGAATLHGAEGTSYTIPAGRTASVWYGAASLRYVRLDGMSGTVTFNNSTFGDVAPFTAKNGYYLLDPEGSGGSLSMSITTDSFGGATYVGEENSTYAGGATTYSAWYGKSKEALARLDNRTGTITYNNATFGDPVFGAKYGWRLTGAYSTITTPHEIDLTSEGSDTWAIFSSGTSGVASNRKASSSSADKISDIGTNISGTQSAYITSSTFGAIYEGNYTDGSSPSSGSTSGATGNDFNQVDGRDWKLGDAINFLADTTERIATLYVLARDKVRVSAVLSDGSAPAVVQTYETNNQATGASIGSLYFFNLIKVQLTYKAASPAQLLRVQVTPDQNGDFDNRNVIYFPAATLAASGSDTTLAASASAIAAAAGALSTSIRLAANAVGVSVANGQLTTQVRMTAAAIAQAVSAAALSTGIRISAAAVMQAAGAGTLTTQIRMMANAAGVANATGSLGLQTTLSANAIAQAAAAAGLATQIRLNSQAQAQASASAGLAGTAAVLSGAAVNIAVANGQLSTLIILDGDAISQAILAGGLTTAILLDADAAAAVIAAGNLQVGVVLDWTDIPVISNVWYPKRTALVLLPYRNRLNLRKLH